MSNREVPFYYDSLANNTTKRVRIGSITFRKKVKFTSLLQTRQNSLQSKFRLNQAVFETRAKCQEFVALFRDDGIPYEIEGPLCCAKTITVRQSKSIEDWEIGKQIEFLWSVG